VARKDHKEPNVTSNILHEEVQDESMEIDDIRFMFYSLLDSPGSLLLHLDRHNPLN
jgi:hypothetical protein